MENDKILYYGVVCWFNKGFGFITREGEPDLFVHYSDLAMEGYKTLVKDQKVSFELGINNRGQPKAVNVKII